MGLALDEARAALAAREMPVGCVFVHAETGAVLARGRNRTNVEFNVRRGRQAAAQARGAVLGVVGEMSTPCMRREGRGADREYGVPAALPIKGVAATCALHHLR